MRRACSFQEPQRKEHSPLYADSSCIEYPTSRGRVHRDSPRTRPFCRNNQLSLAHTAHSPAFSCPLDPPRKVRLVIRHRELFYRKYLAMDATKFRQRLAQASTSQLLVIGITPKLAGKRGPGRQPVQGGPRAGTCHPQPTPLPQDRRFLLAPVRGSRFHPRVASFSHRAERI